MTGFAELAESIFTQKVIFNECPLCKSSLMGFSYERGEVTCKKCGCVVMDKIMDPTGGEKEPWKGRKEVDITVCHKDLPTSLAVTRKSSPHLKRLQRIQSSLTPQERSLHKALQYLIDFFNVLRVENVMIREKAALMLRRIIGRLHGHHGKNFKPLAAGCLFLTYRIHRKAHRIDEFAQAVDLEKGVLFQNISFVVNLLELNVKVLEPRYLALILGNKLDISPRTQEIAQQFIEEGEKNLTLCGKDPSGIAGGALYLAGRKTGEKRTQKEIAEAAGVTTLTIRTRYQEFERQL